MTNNKKRIPKVRLGEPQSAAVQSSCGTPTRRRGRKSAFRQRPMTKPKLARSCKKRRSKLSCCWASTRSRARKRSGGPSMDVGREFRERYTELQLSGLASEVGQSTPKAVSTSQSASSSRGRWPMWPTPKRCTTCNRTAGRTIKGYRTDRQVNARAHVRRRRPQLRCDRAGGANWGGYMGWLRAVPKVRKVKIAKLRQMKGPAAGR